MKHSCKHHQKPTDLDKLKAQLAIKANLKPSDPRLFYAATLANHPDAGDECWVFHSLGFVARGIIMSKTPGTSDTHATWRIRITRVENKVYSYYENMRETFVRSHIWPTKKECYGALHDHFSRRIKENEKENKDLGARRSRIEGLYNECS